MRRMPIPATSVLSAAVLMVFHAAARADLTETRELDESIPVEANQPLRVIVDNVFGSIRVTGHDRATVEMTATETIRGDLQADIDRARAEVELRIQSEPGRVAFRVRNVADGRDGDQDCNCWNNRWNNRWDDYVVKYDIELRVPRAAAIDLSTVNDGEIVVDGVRGDFDVSNVNGEVRLTGLHGAGKVKTVNGDLDASFERAPAGATSFETINGEIDVAFPRNLSADLEFETMHGEIYTDFDVEPLTRDPRSEPRRSGGTLTIRTRRPSAVRIGSGGPTHSFETLNGDIYVREVTR